jgi:hypothetical protein
MITKSYSIMCDCCTQSMPLFSKSIKECEGEAVAMGFKKIKGEWYCDDCKNNNEGSE